MRMLLVSHIRFVVLCCCASFSVPVQGGDCHQRQGERWQFHEGSGRAFLDSNRARHPREMDWLPYLLEQVGGREASRRTATRAIVHVVCGVLWCGVLS